MHALVILGISTALQFTSAVLAVRLIKITGRWRAWSFIAAALALMGVRRAITFYKDVVGDVELSADLTAELVALAISLLMLAGVISIGPLFRRINRIQAEHQEREHRLSMALTASNAGYWVRDVQKNSLFWSDANSRLLGYEPGEVAASFESWTRRIHPDDKDAVTIEFLQHITELTELNIEYRVMLPDGTTRWINNIGSPVFNSDGDAKTFSGIQIDISERKLSERKIHQLAYTDPKTGLPNETAFREKLHQIIDQNHHGFIASIELSELGDITGTFGLEATELIFYELGKRLSNQMGNRSLVAKVGPRLFQIAYVIHGDDQQSITEVAARIFRVAQQPFDLMGSEVLVNVYIGISVIDVVKSTAESMLTNMEIAHYEAMKSVSSCMVYFKDTIKQDLVRSTQIVSWLRSAIERQDFQLFFQPQVNLKTNTIVGCEALIRWQYSKDEWISPGEFIPIAEKSGLIGDITRWTVDKACHTAINWITQKGLNIRIGLNISAEELASPHFLDYMSRYIEETKLPPEVLEIEITETALMKDPQTAASNLQKLRDMGASIAIDDFGTGQASLAYLKNFPIDRLKIDKSFVLGAPSNTTDKAIIVSVIKLAHSLDIDVIAEGAEEKEHIDLLTSLGCDEVQGFYIAKPMPADQYVEFVKQYS